MLELEPALSPKCLHVYVDSTGRPKENLTQSALTYNLVGKPCQYKAPQLVIARQHIQGVFQKSIKIGTINITLTIAEKPADEPV